MSVAIPIFKPVSQMQLTPGSTVTIPDVTWEEFESILQELGDKRASRIAYNQGNLEIMVPLPEHEISKDLISDIIKILLKAKGTAGVEPDACFYIQNYQQMIGRRRLQPDNPPPDLAIEIDVTSKTSLDAYEAIGVPELWIYDSGRLAIYLLKNCKYIKSEQSPYFEDIAITQIIPAAIERSWQVGSFQALEEFAAMIEH